MGADTSTSAPLSSRTTFLKLRQNSFHRMSSALAPRSGWPWQLVVGGKHQGGGLISDAFGGIVESCGNCGKILVINTLPGKPAPVGDAFFDNPRPHSFQYSNKVMAERFW